MECRRCTTGESYRPHVVALFTSEPERTFTRASIFESLASKHTVCQECCSRPRIGSLLYHLRQHGIVERVGKGRFRYRRPDDATKRLRAC
jgi:hypothetical protein